MDGLEAILVVVGAALHRLLEARMGKSGKRKYVQVLRLLETFNVEVLHNPIKDALRMGANGYDGVKHLVLCRIELCPSRTISDQSRIRPFMLS